MYRSSLLALAVVVMTSSASFAFHCPADAAAVDAALTKITLSDGQRTDITALRDQGMAAHAAGNHDEAQTLLADAMRQLLMAL